jgi:exodeoxyribonuclease-5
MKWNTEQSRAIDAVAAWLNDPHAPQVFRLFGYAGTGKTTLARHLAAQHTGVTLFAAYTGKAASVLHERTGVAASTIHALIYLPVDADMVALSALRALANGQPDNDAAREQLVEAELEYRRPKFRRNEESPLKYASLLVLDEVSMVDEALARDLLSFKKKILVLGDPAQLPPITGAGYFTSQDPDVLLTTIHRQALDNPIIHVATLARTGKVIAMGNYGSTVRKVSSSNIDSSFYADASLSGQILCGRNETRQMLNRTVREVKGISHHLFPCAGEQLVCLRNNHGLGLLNGTIWTTHMDAVQVPSRQAVALHVRQDRNVVYDIIADAAPFKNKDIALNLPRDMAAFDYGYAITVHKSQGSQWDTVTLYDDGFGKRDPLLRQQWLYTAVTRAANQLNIIVPQ